MDNNTKDFISIINKAFPHFPINAFPYVGTIEDDDTIHSLLSKVYECGRKSGIAEGEYKKIKEFKNLFKINDED